jgi:hypothetical protein
VSPGDVFSPNWSVEAVAHAIEKVGRGETTRLIINIPPRNLKSICASVALPAFVLGQDPTKRIICVSYADELAKKFSNDCRVVMKSDWYRETFPATVIDKSKDTETEVQTTKRGYRLATSVGGTLTGRGGDLIIIADHHAEARQIAADQAVEHLLTRAPLDILEQQRAGLLSSPTR